MKLIIRPSGAVAILPASVAFEPREGEIVRDATEAEETLVSSGVRVHEVDGVIIEKPAAVPREIANWRARAVLRLAGLFDAVETAMAALDEPARTVASEAWNSGAPFVRNGPTVLQLAADLGLTAEQVDAMFLQAAALEA